jgi:hypothetical protein
MDLATAECKKIYRKGAKDAKKNWRKSQSLFSFFLLAITEPFVYVFEKCYNIAIERRT